MTTDAACPSCGGSGGGPFGPRGSAWDDESYECPRCRGLGVVASPLTEAVREPRPLAKGTTRRPEPAVAEKLVAKRGPVSTRPAANGAVAVATGRKKS